MTINLVPGNTGQRVTDLQRALNAYPGLGMRIPTNGIYDAQTRAAVARFQTLCWLEPDGMAGPCTQDALFRTESHPLILHNVRYVEQPTPTTCWAASTAMVKGGDMAMIRSGTPASMLNQSGALLNDSEAGGGNNHRDYCGLHGLTCHAAQSWTVGRLVGLLRNGPFMMQVLWNQAQFAAGLGSGGHWVTIIGARGSHGPDGKSTTLRVYDPMASSGRMYSATYAAMLRRVPLGTFAIFSR